MKFELEVSDRLRTVEIRRHACGYEVTVDGRTRLVDAVHITDSTWSLIVRDPGGSASRSIDASVIRKPADIGLDVHINGFHFPVRPKAGPGRYARDGDLQVGRAAGPQHVTAPMPGKVVRVLVESGQRVSGRQGVVVIEAMKMENELRAARDGVVRDVLVTEGQSVEAGATLVVVE